ncbi:flavin-containing monooxygenase [Nocardia sp. NPDC059764]|uniref:flavin-containing monooxygenase n=1 Tax=Nocardia sp. NPDC059764 TaxID=3346939 RepID=UPI00365B9B5F
MTAPEAISSEEPDDPVAPDHSVAIIGAGFAGLSMALELRRLGIEDFVIYDRLDGVGGTWRSNVYPGVGVDTPAQLYQYRDHMNPNWSRLFPKGPEVLAYIERVYQENNLLPHVRPNCEVRSRSWDDEHKLWQLRIDDRCVTARFVISAIGPLPEIKPPDLEGLDDYRGTVLQPASWDTSVDLTGKRVAVIGTGASAVQIIPEIAPVARRLTVYQRTPIWVTPKWDPAMPPWLNELFRRAPRVQRLLHESLDSMYSLTVMWVLHYQRTPRIGRMVTQWLDDFYRREIPNDELRAKLLPAYTFPCKPVSPTNAYLRTFLRDNVDLATDSIERITENGIRTVDGTEREIDVLVLATGFRLYYDPQIYRDRPVTGRDGFDMAEFLEKQGASTYHGYSIPGMPNSFTMFGDYGWTGGTYHIAAEVAATHIGRVLAEAGRRDAIDVEVRQAAAEEWTAKTAALTPHSLFEAGICDSTNTQYINHHGQSVFYRPVRTRRARADARSFSLGDYIFAGR